MLAACNLTTKKSAENVDTRKNRDKFGMNMFRLDVKDVSNQERGECLKYASKKCFGQNDPQ